MEPEHEIYPKVYDVFYKMVGAQSEKAEEFNFQFSLNIHHALEVCYLMDQYNVDCFVETGTNLGNTTAFVASVFPELPIFTCENNAEYFEIAEAHLSAYPNVEASKECSSNFLKKDFLNKFKFPFYFLDAHWQGYWPLKDEIKLIKKGVVCVDDFNINHDGHAWDEWNNVSCDIDLLNELVDGGIQIYTNNPEADYIYPDMLPEFMWCSWNPNSPVENITYEVLRHAGRGYYVLGRSDDHLESNDYFKKI